MQLLERDGFTAAQITSLLTGPRLQVDQGCDLLDVNLVLIDDLTADLRAGSVARVMGAKIHGTCKLTLSRQLSWGSQLVRPYMILSDGAVAARFNCGVFSLTTPETPLGESDVSYSVSGLDRVYLLDREVGDDYSVASSTTYYDALVQVFADAGLVGYVIDGEAGDNTLPVDRDWPLVGLSTSPDQTSNPVTWLRIVNDLLGAINFRGVWADENGLFRCQKYLEPAVRAPEFLFDADDTRFSIVGEQRSLTEDIWKTPNRWVFRWTNRPGGMSVTIGDGRFVYDNVNDGPTSQNERGLIWTKVIDYEAASQAVLEDLGLRRVASDLRFTSTVKASTGPFPPAGHADIFTYVDAAAGGTRKVQATSWELDLFGANTSWSWETVS